LPEDSWIRGVVTDGVNPVPNTYIKAMLNMAGNVDVNWTKTDAAGEYIMGVPGGLDYIVFAVNESYLMKLTFTRVVPGQTAWVNMTLTSISPLVTSVTIKGWVKDELGNPVTTGHVLGIVYGPGVGFDAPIYANITTPDGSGNYQVDVIPSDNGGGALAMDVSGYPMTENSSDIQLVGGNTYWFNITLTPEHIGEDATVHGYVRDIDTTLPIASAVVTIETENSWSMQSYSNYTQTDAAGYYEMSVVNGTARMQFSKYGYTMMTIEGLPVPEGASVSQDAQLKMTQAKIRGNVTEAGTSTPMNFARVYLTDRGSNLTMTVVNETGAYELDAFVGENLTLVAEQNGYISNMTTVTVAPGDELWYDFELKLISAWLVGTVTDAANGSPISGVWVHLNSTDFENWANTNSSGHYNFSAPPGTYSVEVWTGGYWQYLNSSVVVVDNVENVHDIALMPWDSALLVGRVTDLITGAPIEDASVWSSGYMGNATTTDANGNYSMHVGAGTQNVRVEASGYVQNESMVDLKNLTTTVHNVSLSPLSPPTTVLLRGYVNGSDSVTPIDGAYVRVHMPDRSYSNQTNTTPTGYYEMYVPPWLLEVTTWASDHAPNFTEINATGLSSYRLDLVLLDDIYAPNITSFSIAPTMNISSPNPSTLDILLQEQYLRDMNVMYLMQLNGSGAYENYTLTNYYSTSYDPWNPSDTLSPFVAGEFYSINVLWAGTITGGLLHNATDQSYFMSYHFFSGSEWFDALRGYYSNATVSNVPGTAFFTSDDGYYVMYRTDFGEMIFPSDVSGVFMPLADIFEFKDGVIISQPRWQVMGAWSVVGLNFSVNADLPSGIYKMAFNAGDWGNHWNGTMVNLTVDNNPPVANAGVDQFVMNGDTVTFDGAGSTDNVGIANYTWVFIYNSATVTLYGRNPTFQFLIDGVYDVTLTVRDGAGHTSTDVMQVNVWSVIPEFPAMIMPVTGMILLFALVQIRRKGSRQ